MKLTQSRYTQLKSRLTRKKNLLDQATTPEGIDKAADAIITECDRALAEFEASGHPDDWSSWERAKDDAQVAKKYRGTHSRTW